ncbi:MAG: PBSX family phage terminase large subunit, partial [Oscillospiraceae bacterium]
YIQTKAGEKIVLVSGGGKDRDERLIKGNTYGTAYVTEANECHPNFIQEVFDRTLSSKGRKIFHDLNPKAPSNWYYTDVLRFHEDKQDENPAYGYNYGHFTIADNMSISRAELNRAIDTYDKKSIWYQRDILGLRKIAEGLVYPMFSPEKHLVDAKPTHGNYYISLDYGTINPTAMGLWNAYHGVGTMVKEYYFDSRKEKRQKTDEEYYTDLADFADGYHIERVIVDPSAASFKECIRRHGKFGVLDANNAVLDGIRLTGTLLRAGRLVFDRSCENTVSEFGAYLWDDKATEDTVIKENDHMMDAVRYFAMTILRREIRK